MRAIENNGRASFEMDYPDRSQIRCRFNLTVRSRSCFWCWPVADGQLSGTNREKADPQPIPKMTIERTLDDPQIASTNSENAQSGDLRGDRKPGSENRTGT